MDPEDEQRQAGRQLKKGALENAPAQGGRPMRPGGSGRMASDASVGGRPSPLTSGGRVPLEPSLSSARLLSGRRGGAGRLQVRTFESSSTFSKEPSSLRQPCVDSSD